MNIVDKLRKLSESIEQQAGELIVEADSTEICEMIANATAAAATALEKTAMALEVAGHATIITPETLDEMAAIAEAFDQSGDPLLKKQASVLDEILLTIGAPKEELRRIKDANEEELDKLRAKYRTQTREDLYTKARDSLNEQNLVEKTRKAVETQVKPRRPLQESLSTRYPPDMPGGHLTRIGDGVYQCVTTGKIYDYKNGYTTSKGNQIPGTCVERQTTDLGDDRAIQTVFNTRQTAMSRFASDGNIDGVVAALKGAGLDDDAINALMEVINELRQQPEDSSLPQI